MARSITSDEVHNAADVLLAAGTRPTVERIRLALGRGSPNTIGPMLEGWWTQVSQRLQHQLTLPDVPEAVAAVMARVWETALETSRTQAESALAPMRAQLSEELANVEARLADARENVNQARAQQQQAMSASQTAQTALAISERRADELATQVSHLQRQGDELNQRHGAQETQLQAALTRLERERTVAKVERDTLQAHLRQIEDRAYTEIDRLRQELKAAKAHLTTQAREHTAALRAAEQAQRTAEKAQHVAERAGAAAQARVDALTAATPPKARPAKKTGTPRRRGTAAR